MISDADLEQARDDLRQWDASSGQPDSQPQASAIRCCRLRPGMRPQSASSLRRHIRLPGLAAPQAGSSAGPGIRRERTQSPHSNIPPPGPPGRSEMADLRVVGPEASARPRSTESAFGSLMNG